MVSGQGSNLRALVDACAAGHCNARVVGVVSDRTHAPALAFAAQHHIDTAVVPLQKNGDRSAWDRDLTDAVASFNPDLVVMAGFMRLVGTAFLTRFARRAINVHPSLLPSFKGMDAPAQALAAGARVSGCTVHVVDPEVDSGTILGPIRRRCIPR